MIVFRTDEAWPQSARAIEARRRLKDTAVKKSLARKKPATRCPKRSSIGGMSTPAPKIDKAESRSIRVQIRHVLLEVWDPIGVKDEPNAQDEYDGYLGGVYQLLVEGASDDSIADHLWRIVTENMGLEAAKKSDMAETVQALRQIPLPVT
jgi:hypothetical protein